MLEDLVYKFTSSVTDLTDLVLVLVGAGASGAIIEFAKKYIPVEGMSDEMLTTVLGFILWYYGDRISEKLVPLGLGLFIAGAGSYVGEWVGKIIPK